MDLLGRRLPSMKYNAERGRTGMSSPGDPIEGIVERRIREAQESGVFDNLPGAGKPLRNRGGPRDENWWLRQYLMREGIDGVPFLPPAIALRKEGEDLQEAVASLPTEHHVREVVENLTRRILDALKKPAADGPPMALMQVDVERIIFLWRLSRIGIAKATSTPIPVQRRPRPR